MSGEVMQVSGLSKCFFSDESQNPFCALSDITFSLKQGDLLAIIGKNGSGKSTLLKILSEIYKPTSGKAIITGKVASVLEIGTGFHPDLTGRENIFFYGVLTGFSNAELKSKFDEIVELSGLAAFIDSPLRNYSSGMFVRLAVSVILCLRCDVLILDEVIGAGDSEFRLKMAEHMQKLTDNGTTILMASHNMNELFKCNAVLWLETGKAKKFDYDKNILIEYIEQNIKTFRLTGHSNQNNTALGKGGSGLSCAGVMLNELSFTDKDHRPKSIYAHDEEIYMLLKVKVLDRAVTFPFLIGIHDAMDNPLFVTSYQAYNPLYKTGNQGDEILFTAILPAHFFNQGSYFVSLCGMDVDGYFRDLGKNVASFTILAANKTAFAPRGSFMPGLTRPQINWQIANTGFKM